MTSRTPAHLGEMLDVFEERCRAQTRASYAAAHNGADYDASKVHEERVPDGEELTFFHSHVLPKTSLRTFAAFMVRAPIPVDLTTVSIAVVLMLRYNATHPVTAHMMHRLFVACVLVGAKAHQDKFASNRLLGKAVGVVLVEMNRIEVTLIRALDWRLVVTQQDVNDAVVTLASPCGASFGSASADSMYAPHDGNTVLLLRWYAAAAGSTSPNPDVRETGQREMPCA